jgi:hypothetical protein
MAAAIFAAAASVLWNRWAWTVKVTTGVAWPSRGLIVRRRLHLDLGHKSRLAHPAARCRVSVGAFRRIDISSTWSQGWAADWRLTDYAGTAEGPDCAGYRRRRRHRRGRRVGAGPGRGCRHRLRPQRRYGRGDGGSAQGGRPRGLGRDAGRQRPRGGRRVRPPCCVALRQRLHSGQQRRRRRHGEAGRCGVRGHLGPQHRRPPDRNLRRDDRHASGPQGHPRDHRQRRVGRGLHQRLCPCRLHRRQGPGSAHSPRPCAANWRPSASG